MPPAIHISTTVSRYARGITFAAFILASGLFPARAQDPPPGLIKRVAEKESAAQAARAQYLYRQSVQLEELQPRGGLFREVREVIFSPEGERSEKLESLPTNTLQRLRLTPEDFDDIRNIQPVLLTPEVLPRYTVRFRGEEIVDGTDCWVLELTPRQIFPGFRLFEGLVWAEKKELGIVRIHGQAVPPIHHAGSDNLFPRFTTLRQKVEGGHWFPVLTWADDTLPFRTGPIRIKMTIRYTNYRRFGAESNITFDSPAEPRPAAPPKQP